MGGKQQKHRRPCLLEGTRPRRWDRGSIAGGLRVVRREGVGGRARAHLQLASLWSAALKSRYSVWMLECMLLLKKNKNFLTTTEQAAAEVARRKKAKRTTKA